MTWDEEKQHGAVEEISTVPTTRPQRPLTADEKLAATTVNVSSSHGSSASSRDLDHDRDHAVPTSTDAADDDQPHYLATSRVPGAATLYRFAVAFDGAVLAPLRRFEALMDRTLGVEAEAIDRKLPSERTQVSLWQSLTMALMWASGVLTLSCFATGLLGGTVFGLSLKQNILICVFGSLLGGAVSGFCATLGPGTGLRQISIGRYSMGWYPNKIVAFLNVVQQLGWSAVGCITGGLALTAVSDGTVSIAVGIVIIAILSLCVSFIGLRAILVWERYAWLVYVIIFLIIFGMTGPYAADSLPATVTGATLSGNILSLLAIVYGSSASWATIASDYYAHYPVNTSRTKVFILTSLGISLPTAMGMVAGAVVDSALNNRADWAAQYDLGLGYLAQAMLHPRGFAKFILVLLVLSGINSNILNTYSAAISCQQFARPFARLPRFVWTIGCFGVIVALALAGRDHLLVYLQNFLSLLGYWCTTYFVIVFSEHYFFRKGRFENYDLEGWNDPKRVPIGVAGMTAFSLGVVAWVMGMVETWYVGPLGKLIGEYGGDVANEFAFVVALCSYAPVRYWELKKFGR